jgi:putative transposase
MAPIGFNPKMHHRRSIRIPGYDYGLPGAYFVTVVTFGRACLFGDIIDQGMQLNEAGLIVTQEWFRTATVRKMIRLQKEELVIMPNHLHAILRPYPPGRS